ncbi:uncharacterized protein LOC110463402 [Mizuhopecten yessoensis]|uniref:uncharacterized protein LOC110463402 n=1 Tax=Mizuhopecten yessoensis TaxID=6573 RepID=UPI000B458193|nr:uncharacterized protein LOC110463402 [Mizuhopecten yessoensis]
MSQKSKNASMTVRFWEPYVGRCPTSPVDHAVTVHVDNGNPTTSPSRQGSTATINHTVHLHTSTASPTASQSSVHPQTTEVQSTKSTKSTASTLLPADTEKESQSMSGAVLGIIIGACLIVAGGIATGIICALCKKNKRQVDDKNSMNG